MSIFGSDEADRIGPPPGGDPEGFEDYYGPDQAGPGLGADEPVSFAPTSPGPAPAPAPTVAPAIMQAPAPVATGGSNTPGFVLGLLVGGGLVTLLWQGGKRGWFSS